MSGSKTSSTPPHKAPWLCKPPASPDLYSRAPFGGVTKVKTTGTTDLKLATERAEAATEQRQCEHRFNFLPCTSEPIGKGKTRSIWVHLNCSVYLQGGSPYYYARSTIDGVTKARTTRTADPKEAMKLAAKFYLERAKQCGRGESAAVKPSQRNDIFNNLTDDYLDKIRTVVCDREWRDRRNHLTSPNGPANYFSGWSAADITTDDIDCCIRHAEEHSTKGKLSPATKKRYISGIRGVLKLAQDRGLIATIPRMPRVKSKDAPRSYFTQSEYRRLCSTAHSLAQRAQKANDARSAAAWHDLGDLLAFLLNTFLRPSEWSYLRQCDVNVIRSGETPHIHFILKAGKTGTRPVASMPSAVKVYDRIVARNGADPDSYLFFNGYSNRATAQEKAGRLFRQLVDETGLRLDPLGRPRTMYCLRHSALGLRLLKAEGLDLVTLARAAGTSVQMIDRFYASHLAPAMQLSALQSSRRRPGA